MSRWYATPATTPRFTEAQDIFVRFIARNYLYLPRHQRAEIKFLELGSGSGADLRYLERHGFDALGIDSGRFAYANYHCDFSAFPWGGFDNHFDCIYDLNTLCTVEQPPYQAIADALKPNGKFFSVVPAADTEDDYSHLEFVRRYSPDDIHSVLNMFSRVRFWPFTYWHRYQCRNWHIEADK